MLKINLLPSRREGSSARSDTNRTFGIALGVSGAALLIGLTWYHSSRAADLDRAKRENDTVQNQASSIRARVADHQKVRDELAEIRAREDAISHLEAARTGPTSMLIELSHLLSRGGRPSVDAATMERIQRENSAPTYNSTWDPHRIWLSRFNEESRAVVIEGSGRTADDVGEFMRRMMLSQYFERVQLDRSQGALDEATKIAVQKFKVSARVRY